MINELFRNYTLRLAAISFAFLPFSFAKAQDTPAKLSTADRQFITEAYGGGLAEVKLGELAKSKATSPEVKALADRLIADHQKADAELKKLAESKGVTLPTEPPRAAKSAYDSLEKKQGAEFDRTFARHAVEDHKKDITKFEQTARKTQDTDVKKFIENTLPVLKEHLEIAKTAEGNGR